MGGSNGSGKLAVAVVGFFAVVIGAIVTGGVTYWIDHDRAKGNERGPSGLSSSRSPDRRPPRRELTPDRGCPKSRGAPSAQQLARSLNNVEWAWVSRYYRDLAEFRARVPGERHRLEHDDKDCTLVALNVWLYSQSQQFTALRKSGTCTKRPAAP